jgi:DNA-binding MarR family transcriptional regulator
MSLKLKGLQKAVRGIRAKAPELPIQQLQILIEIALQEGMTATEIERRCKMTNSSASRNIRALELLAGAGRTGLDWVSPQYDPNDLRIKKLYLTDKGREAVQGIVDCL